jgi:thioredoxin-related protein
MKLLISTLFLIALSLQAFAEDNHQDKAGQCKQKKTKDEQKYCFAIVHKDGTGCESIVSYELRTHCMHEVAEYTRHDFNTYTPKKKGD